MRGGMKGRMCLLAFVAASGAVHLLAHLPGRSMWLVTAFIITLLSIVTWVVGWRSLALALLAGLAGFLFTLARAEHRLADALSAHNENKVSRVVLRVSGLPRLDPDKRVFDAEVLSSNPEGVPTQIRVTWNAPGYSGPYGRRGDAYDFPEIVPGQVWRMALTLKTPRGTRNPHAFDYEGHVFAQSVRATASVRGTPRLLRDEPHASLSIIAQRARHYVRAALLEHVGGYRYGAVLLALVIGDQASVSASDWQVFNRSGITHLVSISGSHITMIAAIGGASMFWFWRRVRIGGRMLAERVPAHVASAATALLVAWLYCLLAGWGVPARRTFLMLAVVALFYVLRLGLNASRLLCLVAFVVVLLDPWALLQSGFWLSFSAVAVLMISAAWAGRAVGNTDMSAGQRFLGYARTAVGLQMAISLALTPALAFMFHEVSAVSPLVNAYAIPVIGLVVTPLALLAGGVALVPGLGWLAGLLASFSHSALHLAMLPTVWLASLPAASFSVAAAPLWTLLLCLPGLALALAPYGPPLRHAGWLLMLPALCWQPARPDQGGWSLYALDVGQAGAVVVRTAKHVLVFDAGARHSPDADDGTRVLAPFLRSLGVRRINTLVVSHADLDHAGGVGGLLQAFRVDQAYSSFDLTSYLAREAQLLGTQPMLPQRLARCEYGVTWQVDGVTFEFLWPTKHFAASLVQGTGDKTHSPKLSGRRGNARNAGSCVLRIRGAHHSALLPGDIGKREEFMLVDRGLEKVDLVLAPHHGSKSSSSPRFVRATKPSDVIAQAGFQSRHGHPSPEVQARWSDHGARFWRTDLHGAVIVHSEAKGLSVSAVRDKNRRYWHASRKGD